MCTILHCLGGDDFAPISGSITVNLFESSAPSIILNITDDTLFEDNETFIIDFSDCLSSSTCVIISSNVTVIILNDDGK